MIGFLTFLVFFIIGMLLAKGWYMKEFQAGNEAFQGIIKIVSIAIMAIILTNFMPFGIVQAGYRGVVLQFGAVTGDIKGEGLYIVVPFVQSVQPMEVRIVKEQTDATAASKDLQNVTSTIAVNYHIDPTQVAKLYQNIGLDFKSRVIDPAIQESFKESTSQYTAEQLITRREEVKNVSKKRLEEKLRRDGIIIDGINIVNFKFSPEFEAAIETKVTAEQQALAAKNQLERVKYEAQQQVEAAKGKAEATRVEGTAITNNPQILQMRALEKWNGVLPVYMGGSSPIPFINVK